MAAWTGESTDKVVHTHGWWVGAGSWQEASVLYHGRVPAKSLQSCPSLCDPVGHSPPVSTQGIPQKSRLPCSSPGDLPDPGVEPLSLTSPELTGRFFTTSTTWEAQTFSKGDLSVPAWQLDSLRIDGLEGARQKLHNLSSRVTHHSFCFISLCDTFYFPAVHLIICPPFMWALWKQYFSPFFLFFIALIIFFYWLPIIFCF